MTKHLLSDAVIASILVIYTLRTFLMEHQGPGTESESERVVD